MHKTGVQTRNIVDDENPLEGFKKIAKAGFKCCDFSLDSYLRYEEFASDYDKERFFDKSVDELCSYFAPHKRAADECGIIINQMHMPYPLYATNVSEEANEYLRYAMMPKSMEICKFLECPNIVVHQFNLLSDAKTCQMEEEGAEWKANAAYLHAIAPFAAQNGITICLENLYRKSTPYMIEGPCCDPVKLAARIDYFNAMYKMRVLGACFDTGHANLVNMDMVSYLKILGDRVRALHIHDNDCRTDLHQIPYTFTNTRDKICSLDWTSFIDTLKAIGFDGVLSFETAPTLDAFPEELKDEVLWFIAAIGNYFSKKLED